jgi:osmotically-inducible protein OsmY
MPAEHVPDRRWRRLIAASSIALAVGLITPALKAAPPALSDQAISDAIEEELLSAQAVPMTRLDIKTENGVVTLTGTVDNVLAKTRAARVASTVKGARAVVNRIEVQPDEPRSDQEIRTDVALALAADPAADAYELTAEVEDGVVTLSGTVESWQEEQLAIMAAKGVAGVRAVKSNIDINYGVERTDAQIAADVRRALAADVLVDDGMIDVTVEDAHVELTGTVGSLAQRNEAYGDAWVMGVESVDVSGLEVAWWASDENLRQDKYVEKSDQAIRRALQAALRMDPRVSMFDIAVDVSDGRVTLHGAVDNLKAKRAAANDARHTVGVRYVQNNIKIEPVQPLTDAEIAANIREALQRDPFIEAGEVSVNVNDGVARLTGTVDTFFERAQADDVIARVEGVSAIENDLLVSADLDPLYYDPYVDEFYTFDIEYDYDAEREWADDAEIRESIEDHMWWSPFVDADDVYVTVNDGVAALTGTVDTLAERRAATENAYDGGAIRVENELAVL